MERNPAGLSIANNWIIGKLASVRNQFRLVFLITLDWALWRLTDWRARVAGASEEVRDRYARRLTNRYLRRGR